MPQVFQVLKCYKCSVFQVHQTKKSNKFACKMCGEKQSIKRHYGVGNGQECRMHVQKLNIVRGELLETSLTGEDLVENEEVHTLSTNVEVIQGQNSKWTEFVRNEVKVLPKETKDEIMYLDNKEVVLELPNRKLQRKRSKSCSKSSIIDGLHGKSNITIDIEYNKECDKKVPSLDTISSLNSVKKQLKNIVYDSETSSHSCGNGDNLHYDITDNIEPNSKVIYRQKEIKRIFFPPVLNAKSKWSLFENNIDNEHTEITEYAVVKESELCNNIHHNNKKLKIDTNINYKKYGTNSKENSTEGKKADNNTLGTSCRNSKWTSFLDEPINEIENNEQNIDTESCSAKNLQKIFLLCDDDKEIDNFLAI